MTTRQTNFAPPAFRALAGAAVLSGVLATIAPAQDATVSAEPAPAAYAVPETETWSIQSRSGDRYEIFVSRPTGEAPAAGFPVLYVLDGNTMFATFAEARRMLGYRDDNIRNSIIVAVGYPTDALFALKRRMVDFTPPWPETVPPAQANLKDWQTGGQDAFLDFLLDTLRPVVAARYPVNPDRQALFGHSLGGLFALHTLYTAPEAFSAIIAASPSQYWNEQAILTEERAFAAQLSAGEIADPARLMLTVGELEGSITNLWDAEALAERLKPLSAWGLRSRFEDYDNEEHLGVPLQSVPGAIRFAFSKPW